MQELNVFLSCEPTGAIKSCFLKKKERNYNMENGLEVDPPWCWENRGEPVRLVQVKGEVGPSEAMAWGGEREFIQEESVRQDVAWAWDEGREGSLIQELCSSFLLAHCLLIKTFASVICFDPQNCPWNSAGQMIFSLDRWRTRVSEKWRDGLLKNPSAWTQVSCWPVWSPFSKSPWPHLPGCFKGGSSCVWEQGWGAPR